MWSCEVYGLLGTDLYAFPALWKRLSTESLSKMFPSTPASVPKQTHAALRMEFALFLEILVLHSDGRNVGAMLLELFSYQGRCS